jgi:hypothetical protein
MSILRRLTTKLLGLDDEYEVRVRSGVTLANLVFVLVLVVGIFKMGSTYFLPWPYTPHGVHGRFFSGYWFFQNICYNSNRTLFTDPFLKF